LPPPFSISRSPGIASKADDPPKPMPPLSPPQTGAPEIIIPSAGALRLSPESFCQNGPLCLRVYRGGCSFGTDGAIAPPDSPDPDDPS